MMVSKMAKKVRLIFILFVGIIIVAVASLVVVNILNDENKLTVEENKWINNNYKTINITGGEDANNTVVIDWFKNHGERIK